MSRLGKEDYMIRMLCWLGGFFLMLGISSRNIGASCCVCFLIIISSAKETNMIMRVKKIREIHWFCSDWVLMAAAFAYIGAENFFVKIFWVFCMFLCVYLRLYRICYYEKISREHIKRIIGDFPILCLYNVSWFWCGGEPFEIKEKRRRIIVGIFSLLILTIGIFLPLYAAVDSEISEFTIAVLWNGINKLPVGIACAILGMIPAVINYSIIKGLIEDVVERNPERFVEISNDIGFNGLFYNKEVLKIVLWGLVLLNMLFVGLQINYLLRYQLYEYNMENPYDLQGGLPLLVAVIISLFFVFISEYAIESNNVKDIRFVTLIYILSLCTMTILLLYRYILKITKSGIDNMNLVGLFCALLILLLFWFSLYFISSIGADIWKKAAVAGTIIFLLIALLPVKYIVSNINVYIFMNKYENGKISNTVSEKDIDLAYFNQMGYDSIFALTKLAGVTLEYEPTQKSVQETTGEILFNCFSADLTITERNGLSELETDEKLRQVIIILEDRPAYRMAGMKQVALDKLKEFQKKYIIIE